MKKILPKIIVIVGPTASGKTALSLSLAKKFNGEIVNADSRQVYRGMNIGTAKPLGGLRATDYGLRTTARVADYGLGVVDGIPHHLFDIVSPDEEFTLAHYKKAAVAAIKDILKRKKLPIVVGGTGLYIWALVDNLDIPEVAPDLVLRAKLEKMPLAELVEKLKKADPETAGRVDLKNPRRVIRALEVALSAGAFKPKKSLPLFDVLQIGLNPSREELNRRISQRVEEQIKDGLVEEVKKLVAPSPSSIPACRQAGSPRAGGDIWDLPAMSGIGYRQLRSYLEGRETLAGAIEAIKRDTRHYAKRQMTWFRRDKRIKWVETVGEAAALANDFLSE